MKVKFIRGGYGVGKVTEVLLVSPSFVNASLSYGAVLGNRGMMIMATSLIPQLCSTSVVEDVHNQDEVVGIKLSYTYNSCFFTVLISSDLYRDAGIRQSGDDNAATIQDFISRFNDACTVTEEDEFIADVDQRLDCLWREAEDWVQGEVFEKIVCLGRKHGGSPSRAAADNRKPCNLLDYIYPKCFNLQLVATEDGFDSILRPDLDPCFPFAVESGIHSDRQLMRFHAREIEVLHRPRAHVLQVRTIHGVFCCKLNNAGAQNSFLREFNTLRDIGKKAPAHIRVPRLRGTVEVMGGTIGFLTDWVDTEDSNLTACLERRRDLSVSSRQKWADHIWETVHFLHSNNFIWGDAKTNNTLIDKEGNAWLIDFGGGFTQGWIDENLYDTREGDLQGVRNTIMDIFRRT